MAETDPPSPAPVAQPPRLPDRVTDGLCLAFAAWTLTSHAVVWAEGNLRDLTWAAAALGIAGLLLCLWRARRAPSSDVTAPGVAGNERDDVLEARVASVEGSTDESTRRLVNTALIALGVLGTAAWFYDFHLGWTLTTLALAAGWLFTLRDRQPAEPASRGRRSEAGLWLLVAVGAVVTLVVSRPDIDDCFYVNLAVGAADAPDAPLLRDDTLHGIPDLPIQLPVYRLHTYEMISAVLTHVTGVDALVWCHLWVPLLAALMVVLAHARLFRQLVPGRWLAATVVLVLVYLFVGETHRWHSNFAFVRLQQGKSVLLSAALPLVMAYALEFARRPSAARWALLAAAQVAAVGLTATALWLAPLTAGLCLVATFDGTRRSALRATLGVGASFYPVLLALAMRASTASVVSGLDPGTDRIEWLVHSATRVIGTGGVAVACVLAVAAAWWTCRPSVARRALLLVPLALLVGFYNPWVVDFIAARVTGAITYWRVLWILPLPLYLALLLSAPMDDRAPWPRAAGGVLALVATTAFLVFAPRFAVLTERNKASFAPLQIKVAGEFHVAKAIADSVAPGATVLAPSPVCAWLPTLHDHPYPLVTRRHYIETYLPQLGKKEVQRRLDLLRVVSGTDPSLPDVDRVGEAVDTYDLQAVCYRKSAARKRQLYQRLKSKGMETVYSDDEFMVMAR